MSNNQSQPLVGGAMGSVSGWTEYSTDTEASVTNKQPVNFTLPELLEEIKRIKRSFDPKALEKFRLLIEDHFHDEHNPHKVTLESMGTSVVAELYKAWQDQGYTGSQDDFLKILFQYVEIADIPTTLEGLSSAKLVSVKGAKALYEDHLVDMDAHNEMFRAIFPGHSPDDSPAWAIQGYIGPSSDLIVERQSPMFYHRSDGYLSEVGNNELAVDYIYGDPMFSIWDERTNRFTYSESLDSGTIVGGFKVPLEGIKSPRNIENAIVVTEDNNTGTHEHGWESDQVTFEAGKVYTVSAYMLPMDREYGTIVIPSELAGTNAYCIHSLIDKDRKFIPAGYDKEINASEAIILNNGWVRIIHSFRAKVTTTASIKVLFTDILDGDTTYIGNGGRAGGLYQVQNEQGLHASPIIITEEFPVTRPATISKMEFNHLFNQREGTLIVETKTPYPLQQNEAHTLYDISSETGRTLSGRFPVTHAGRLFFESFNKHDETLDHFWSECHDREITAYVHSYSLQHHTYGATGMFPVTQTLVDNSIAYSQALTHIISEMWSNIALGSGATMIDFTNALVASSTNVDNLSDSEILTHTIGKLYEEVKNNRAFNDLSIIDYLEANELTDAGLLNNAADFIYIGCNRQGTEQLNGYIKSIVYYQTYSDIMETEFHSGEYAYGT